MKQQEESKVETITLSNILGYKEEKEGFIR